MNIHKQQKETFSSINENCLILKIAENLYLLLLTKCSNTSSSNHIHTKKNGNDSILVQKSSECTRLNKGNNFKTSGQILCFFLYELVWVRFPLKRASWISSMRMEDKMRNGPYHISLQKSSQVAGHSINIWRSQIFTHFSNVK